MKRFGMALITGMLLSGVVLCGCDQDKIKALETKNATLTTDNEALTAKVKQCDSMLANVSQERDDLKAAAKHAPPPPPPPPAMAAAPAKAGKKGKHKHR